MKRLCYILLAALCCSCGHEGKDYTALVDTRVGTESRFELSYGNTYPATGRPFGMHLWSPQTGLHGDGWKYKYQDNEIRGFVQSHQCSPWTGDYATLALFPETGQLEPLAACRGAAFSHKDEVAMPHYYSVRFRNGILTEMAPTEHGNHFRFSFPKGGDAYLLIDGTNRIADMSIDAAGRTVRGCISSGRYGRMRLDNWFEIVFDQDFKDYGTWEDNNCVQMRKLDNDNMIAASSSEPELVPAGITPGAAETKGRQGGVYLTFPEGATVDVRIASSYISPEQADVTLKAELGSHTKLEQTVAEGRKVWNESLGRIEVEGGTEETLRTFYTNMYHSSLFPRMFHEMDSEGNPYYFSPFDWEVHKGYMYTDIGYWDAFRSQFPLYNIINREMQGRYMAAIMDIYDQLGWLPSWPFPGETSGMIGNHAVSLLADAWVKGIRTFDIAKALDAYEHEISAERGAHVNSHGRVGASYYDSIGYVPYPEIEAATAMTLEYAYDDFCGWVLANETGNKELMEKYAKGMQNYRNVFDREAGFMRGRDASGRWADGFRPGAWGGPFIEGNSWHYTWSVFQDIRGLVDLFGSEKAFTDRLDRVFSSPAIIDLGYYDDIFNEMVEMVIAGMGQYEHGNQPIHHMAYLYDYAGQPWKTQYWVRQIMQRLYNSGPKGYPGDEDQGSMSAWYVISALGFYSVTPGTTQYALGSPLFGKATINLENGRTFSVEAENNSEENVYIQSATLNGKPLDRNWIDHSEIMEGGILHLVMGPEPETSRGTGRDAAPFSVTDGQ